ncbi:MAG: flagellin [Chlamydiales bacterium]|jgi:flagellin
MYIKNNNIASQLYVPYTQNQRNLGQSARKLSTGEKFPTAADGGGELGVADRWKSVIGGTNKLVDGLENTMGYLAVQDESVVQAANILQRMNELAASALDLTKNTNDRIALDAEFQALENEFSTLYQRKYNGISLFGRSIDVRTGLAASDSLTLSTISLAAITFGSMALSQLASASSAIISMTSRISSLNVFRAKAGNNSNEITRVIDFTRQFVRQLGNAENFVRNIDIALEAGNFTKQQVILAASQSVLSQANGLTQSALQFLG